MIPVPKYLREIAKVYKQKDESLNFGIKCICGCNKFIVLKNLIKKVELSKENKRKIRDSLKWYKEILDPMITNTSYAAAYIGYDNDDFHEIVIYSPPKSSSKFDKEKDKSKIKKIFRIK